MTSRRAFLALPLAAATIVPAFAQTPPALRVGATANDTYGEAYYALDAGFFAKAGLTVNLSTFTNGNAVATAVASGALDLGVTNPVALANAIAHGVPFVYFAGCGLYDSTAPTTQLCVAKDGPVHDPKDLEGKTVANSTLKDITYLATVAYLEKNGVDATKVQMTELPFSEMGVALQRGTVAGAIISEPSMTVAVRAGTARPFGKVFDLIAPRFYISGWFTTKDWYAKNTELAKRYAAVIYATARWANVSANHAQSGEILAKYAKINVETTRAMTRSRFDTALNPALLAPPLALAANAKLTSRPVSAAEMIAG